MDPIAHILLPLLILLAAKQNPRVVVPLAVFAIVPDFDSIFEPHRGVLHNLFVVLLIPLAFVLFARLRRPNLLLPSLLILFFMFSHVMLDIYGGVELFYPFTSEAFYIQPEIIFQTSPGLNIIFRFNAGVVELEPHDDYLVFGDLAFGLVLLFGLTCLIFRREMAGWFRNRVADARWTMELLKKGLGGKSS